MAVIIFTQSTKPAQKLINLSYLPVPFLIKLAIVLNPPHSLFRHIYIYHLLMPYGHSPYTTAYHSPQPRINSSPPRETAKSITPFKLASPLLRGAGELGSDTSRILPAFACLSCSLQGDRLRFDCAGCNQRLLHTVCHLCAGMAQSAGV